MEKKSLKEKTEDLKIRVNVIFYILVLTLIPTLNHLKYLEHLPAWKFLNFIKWVGLFIILLDIFLFITIRLIFKNGK